MIGLDVTTTGASAVVEDCVVVCAIVSPEKTIVTNVMVDGIFLILIFILFLEWMRQKAQPNNVIAIFFNDL
jgi:hypothetical protein